MADDGAIKVMSFNIRFDNPNEAADDKWEARRDDCVEIIKKYQPHLLGLQEPHQNQVDYLGQALTGYKWFGSGRSLTLFGLGEEHNELNPIFYDAEALTLEASGQFWYSDTPDVPGSKWDCSAFPRIANWGRFTVNATGKKLAFINTHFDHESDEARTRAAEMLVARAPGITQGRPTVVVGDLNCGEGSVALEKLCAAFTNCSDGCCDTIPGLLAKCGTFVGFDKTIDSQIDFIFASKGFLPAGYGVIPDERANGHIASDHRPIMADVKFDPDYVTPEPPAEPEGAAPPAPVDPIDAQAQAAAAQAEAMINQGVGKAVDALNSLFKGL